MVVVYAQLAAVSLADGTEPFLKHSHLFKSSGCDSVPGLQGKRSHLFLVAWPGGEIALLGSPSLHGTRERFLGMVVLAGALSTLFDVFVGHGLRVPKTIHPRPVLPSDDEDEQEPQDEDEEPTEANVVP